MNDFAIIFQAEFLRKIRSRPFLIGTLIGALAIVGLAILPALLTGAFAGSSKKIVLAGDAALVAQARPLLRHDFDIVAVVPAPAVAPTLADLDEHKDAAAVVVLQRTGPRVRVDVYARDPANFAGHTVARELVPLNVALGTNVPPGRIGSLLDVPVTVKSLDTKFTDQSSADAAKGIAYILVLLLYMSILINSQTVMASVAEEKTSRIAELLVATTSPALLLAGKIASAGCAGLIQLTVWIGAGLASGSGIAAAFGARGSDSVSALDASGLNPGALDVSQGVVLAFVAFFVLGFLQYATLYAAAASLISRTEDLGSVAAPLVVPVVGGFLLAQYALAFPNATPVVIVSQLPLLSPFVMFTRMVVATVPAWQIVLSIAVNVGALILIVNLAGRVYRVGLLLYGQPPKLRQVIAALRA